MIKTTLAIAMMFCGASSTSLSKAFQLAEEGQNYGDGKPTWVKFEKYVAE